MIGLETVQENNEHLTQIIDFTHNGKCIGCGNCCSTYLPVSNHELKVIYHYIKKHHIQPIQHGVHTHSMAIEDRTCPFRDDEHQRCLIYPVRPWICRRFVCNNTKMNIGLTKKGMSVVNMRYIFQAI